MKKTILTTIIGTIFMFSAQAQLLRTTVAQGEIEGIEHNGFALYKGIPYAEAPVGKLRWKAPVPKKTWNGIYKADKWGNRPPQMNDPNQYGNEIPMSEDCLYLSVETSAKSKDEKLPVFVMIHGGGFLTGSYAGTMDHFVREGIIYVSIEYRLGPLGFMPHPELSKENKKGVSGNYGLLDQIMALQWIHDNIAAFGGDPERVTIAGESAGGISVSILCASPLAKGLFSGAISESGSSFLPLKVEGNNVPIIQYGMNTVKDGEQEGVEFQKQLGAKNIQEMRKLPTEKFIQGYDGKHFGPIVDGYVILDDQVTLYKQGKFNNVPILLGYNSDEGALFESPSITQKELETWARATFASKWFDFYNAYPIYNVSAYYAMCDASRDTKFGWGTYKWATLQSEKDNNVYFYYFDQDCENTILRSTRGGATHVAEMAFIYESKFGNGKMTKVDQQMSKIMTEYWINFTKTGDPNKSLKTDSLEYNCSKLPLWTPYKSNEPTVMYMRNGFHLDTVPNQKQMEFWNHHFDYQRQYNEYKNNK